MTELEPVPRAANSGIFHATLLPLSAPEQLGEALQLAANRRGWSKTEPFTGAEEEESQPIPQQGNSRDPEFMIDRGVSELLERGTIGALLEEGQKESQANIDQFLAKVLLPLV